MGKLIGIFLIILTFASCTNNVYVHTIHYDSETKSVAEERTFINGKIVENKHYNLNGSLDEHITFDKKGKGKGKSFYQGKLDSEGIYQFYENYQGVKNGAIFKNGKFIFYREDSSVRGIIYFKKGNYHGKKIEFYKNGKVSLDGNYENGWATGVWKYYYKTGKIKKKEEYFGNGWPTGIWKYYDEDSKLVKEEYYENKKIVKTVDY